MAVGWGDVIGRGGGLEQLQGDSFGCSIRMSRGIGQVGESVVAQRGWWCCVYIWMLGGSRQGQRVICPCLLWELGLSYPRSPKQTQGGLQSE